MPWRRVYLGVAPRSDDKCARCPEDWADGRWACSLGTDWLDRAGRAPWGDQDSASDRIRYLASMTETEHRELAEIAFNNLEWGCWEGCATPNGGWEDGEPWSETERQWRLTARDFHTRFQSGDCPLTEGMLHYADWDLCRELAWLRGWCPRSGLR